MRANKVEASPESGKRPVGSVAEFIHSWRYFLWVLGLILVVVLFYAEENWRGHWAWERYRRQMSSRGEPLDLSAFIPPRVPDDQNFAQTPFLAPLFDFIPGSQRWVGSNPVQRVSGFAHKYDAASGVLDLPKVMRSNSWINARTDLAAWYAAFLSATNRSHARSAAPQGALAASLSPEQAAAGILRELSECDSILREAQDASRRPYCRFNLRYEEENPAGILLPHLAVLKRICQVLQLRASARLALNQTEDAYKDLQLMLYVSRACRQEPTIISQLVSMAEFYLALQPFAEGFGQWSEPQLRELQDTLGQLNFCADVQRSLAAERGFGCAIIEYLRRSMDKPNQLGNVSGGPQDGPVGLLMAAGPDGWVDLEKLNYCRFVSDSILPAIDVAGQRINPTTVHISREQLSALAGHSGMALYLRHRFFCSLLVPGIEGTLRKAAFGQNAANVALIACALERYRLSHGQMPQSLDALVPEFVAKIPHDIINGEALKYRLAGPEHYVLYSVGWNAVDDGGTVGVKKVGEDVAAEQGDWVWQLP
ncbi:MAG TPA: hypothetical protein VL361_02375 [Candidatus Limnocylindrales bacterium]|jgi:hypothetical protein|nr:hypothetical protein [Candidatus Limnocylindrales bacterium]